MSASAWGGAIAQPLQNRPKIGCCSFNFHSLGPRANPEEAIDLIGDLGFEGIELIVAARDALRDYWTVAKQDETLRRLEKWKLELPALTVFQPMLEGITSVNPEERGRNFDIFEQVCKLARRLRAPAVGLAAPWPREMRGPREYLPRYTELENPRPGEKFHIDLDPSFDWDNIWAAYIRTLRECLDRAKAYGLKISIEHQAHSMVPDVASFLRLFDAIRDPMLGYTMDTGWTLSAREYPPVAIHQIKRHLMSVHARDIDGLMHRFPPFGEGVVDFRQIAQTLKLVGYRGYVHLAQDRSLPADSRAAARRFLAAMKEYLA